MIAIIAALPREIAALVRGVQPDAALLRRKIYLYRLPNAVVVAAGMGAQRATLAVEAAMTNAQIDTLVSVGLAGSCDQVWTSGSVVIVSEVIDTTTGERYATGVEGKILATQGHIASVQEKQRLGATYGAVAVDMEAATVGRLARARGLRFQSVKAISDDLTFELEGLSKFSTPEGQFRTAAFALHTAARPWTWGKAVALGRNSEAALKALTHAVRQLIDNSVREV